MRVKEEERKNRSWREEERREERRKDKRINLKYFDRSWIRQDTGHNLSNPIRWLPIYISYLKG